MAVSTFEKWGGLALQSIGFLSLLWLTSNWSPKPRSGPCEPRAPFLKVTCGKTSLPQKRFMLYLFSWNLLPPGRPATSPEGEAIWNQRVVYFFFCCYVFSKENKRLQHFSNSEGKSKSNYDVIHPGKMKWQIYHFVQNSRVCLFFYPALEVFIFLFSVQLQWNIYSPGMNSQCFPSVCFSQIIRDSGMVCSGKGMVFCGDRWVFSNDSTCLSASQASLGGLSPQTSQLLAYFSQFSQLSSCDRLHLGQISIIAKIVFL